MATLLPRLDTEAAAYVEGVIEEMTTRFNYTRDAAIEKINAWLGPVEITSESMLFHETCAFWACRIHYGKHDFWRTHPNPDDEWKAEKK